MSTEPIKIFVTYCWTDKEGNFDEEHQKKVRAFVDLLSDYQDFDATFDLYENQASTATNFIRMMYENITKSKKVIIVLSEGYQLKADDFKGGVGVEYQGIMNDIQQNHRKYILVSFDKRSGEIYPFGLQGRDTVLLKNGDLESNENEDNKNILFSKLKDEAIYERPVHGSKTAIVKKK
jgi:DNA polymerase II small subunit/DNA polymerase delta subunit B